MLTTAVPEGENDPDWFFVDVRDVPWDGSQGLRLAAEWDGYGMAATQSHGMAYEAFPATRFAWPGTGAQSPTPQHHSWAALFTAVVLGVVEIAVSSARGSLLELLDDLRPYEQVEWTRAESEAWLAAQAYEGMLRARGIEAAAEPRRADRKESVAELAESARHGSAASSAEAPSPAAHRSATGSKTCAHSASFVHPGASRTTLSSARLSPHAPDLIGAPC